MVITEDWIDELRIARDIVIESGVFTIADVRITHAIYRRIKVVGMPPNDAVDYGGQAANHTRSIVVDNGVVDESRLINPSAEKSTAEKYAPPLALSKMRLLMSLGKLPAL